MDTLEPRPVAVTVVGGFLGAGKTTLINRMMAHLEGTPTAVMVNDFGTINVDAQQITKVEGDVIELSNGCICCTIRNDVTSQMLSLVEARSELRHILIETSGVSDPRAVAQSMLELQRLGGVRLDGLISVVDAEQFDGSQKLARAQIVAADVLLLNKVDQASEEQKQRVRAEITRIAPQAVVIETVQADAPMEALLAVETDTRRLEGIPVLDAHLHDARDPHAHGFATSSFRTEQPLSWEKLVPVLSSLGREVYRVKGVLQLKERPGDRLLLHVVGHRIYVRTIEPWGEVAPHTELTMIGKAGFDADAIEARLLG